MKEIEKLRPFTKFCITIGMIPSSYKNSLTYEEQLLWLCNYLEETVIPAVNNNGEAVTELQELFIELKSYVENYFNNLDVQEEINKKLDKMAEDGVLTNLIEKYVNPYINIQNEKINNMNEKINSAMSGSPLVASSVDDMTDISRTYVNTSDGNWYYYNGSSWVVGGIYQATQDSLKVNELEKDINVLYDSVKFNKTSFNNYFIWNLGQWISSGAISTTQNTRIYASQSVNKSFANKIIANEGYNFNCLRFRNGVFINSSGWISSYDLSSEEEDVEIKLNVRKEDDSQFIEIPTNTIYFEMDTAINMNNENNNGLTNRINFLHNLVNVKWESGRINMETDNLPNSTNIRTVDFLPSNIIKAYSLPNFQFTVWAYDKETSEKIGIWNGNTFANNGIWVSSFNFANYSQYKFKLFMKHIEEINLDTTASNYIILTEQENEINNKSIDLVIFMGQSNMAGRGNYENAPLVIEGAGYEYRAISDPTKLYPIEEPFGVNENNPNGIDDTSSGDGSKSGSMVSAFVNAYYKNGNIPIIGVSASKGATSIEQWLPNTPLLNDTIQRLNSAVAFCNNNGFTIRHKYIVWCQGETDGKNGMSKETYINNLQNIINEMKLNGIEKLLMVRIGNRNENGNENMYKDIIDAQTEMAKNNEDVIMVSTDLAGMKDRGLMKDQSHYYQAGYNEVGTYAGVNSSIYANTGKEPTMYDTEYDNLYYCHKN